MQKVFVLFVQVWDICLLFCRDFCLLPQFHGDEWNDCSLGKPNSEVCFWKQCPCYTNITVNLDLPHTKKNNTNVSEKSKLVTSTHYCLCKHQLTLQLLSPKQLHFNYHFMCHFTPFQGLHLSCHYNWPSLVKASISTLFCACTCTTETSSTFSMSTLTATSVSFSASVSTPTSTSFNASALFTISIPLSFGNYELSNTFQRL